MVGWPSVHVSHFPPQFENVSYGPAETMKLTLNTPVSLTSDPLSTEKIGQLKVFYIHRFITPAIKDKKLINSNYISETEVFSKLAFVRQQNEKSKRNRLRTNWCKKNLHFTFFTSVETSGSNYTRLLGLKC